MTNNNVFLIGARATGKSTVGVELAARLSRQFVDLDEWITRRQGRTISEMVAAQGWPFFRGLERQALLEVSARQNQVVATGGGAVLHEDIWPQVMERGVVIWLRADAETMRARILGDAVSGAQRPSLTGGDPAGEALTILRERTPLYERGSHFSVDSTREVGAIVERIVALIK